MIEIKNLSKTFVGRSDPNEDVEALKNVNLSIPDGSIYGIIGMSGAGKSTLVRCINMLERPTEGTVIIDGVDMAALSNKDLRAKRKEVTMIFQSFNLLMQRTCLKNICFPLELIGVKKADAERRAMELLEIVGLPDKANAYPAQLSGGQQQRIAIARALATNPKVLLCDEATSALDPKTTHQILELIKEINKNLGITCIVITHQMSVIEEICGRVAILEKGVVVEEGEVAEVFAHPKSTAARHLVYPDGGNSDILALRDGEQRIRVVFNGAVATERPLIAQLAKELGIEASILGANTKSIGERAYGNMILGIMGSRDDMLRAKEYLESVADVVVEEVTE